MVRVHETVGPTPTSPTNVMRNFLKPTASKIGIFVAIVGLSFFLAILSVGYCKYGCPFLISTLLTIFLPIFTPLFFDLLELLGVSDISVGALPILVIVLEITYLYIFSCLVYLIFRRLKGLNK